MTGAVLLSLLALGISGFDPFGGFVAAAVLLGRPSRRAVVALGCGLLTATVACGFLVGAVGEATAAALSSLLQQVPHGAWLTVQITLAIGLVALGLYQIRNPPTSQDPPFAKLLNGSRGAPRLFLLGTLVALSQVPDPTFIAAIALLESNTSAVGMAVGLLIWGALSQLAMMALVVAGALGAHENAVTRFQGWWARHGTTLMRSLGVVVCGAGIVMLGEGTISSLNGHPTWLARSLAMG